MCEETEVPGDRVLPGEEAARNEPHLAWRGGLLCAATPLDGGTQGPLCGFRKRPSPHRLQGERIPLPCRALACCVNSRVPESPVLARGSSPQGSPRRRVGSPNRRRRAVRCGSSVYGSCLSPARLSHASSPQGVPVHRGESIGSSAENRVPGMGPGTSGDSCGEMVAAWVPPRLSL